MDKVFLHDLRVQTTIGIFDWERRIRQTIGIDLEMASDVRKAAATDEIGDALDYKKVAKRIIAFVEAAEFQLVESLAEAIAKIVTDEFSVPWVRVSVNKQGAVRGAAGVGIIIERGEVAGG
ncbi:MAG: dihydroneopterin aldolase [Proteobacteria bacterium]|nr:dihydroneopterin aldolase [Pseudomonadota bacterium]